jgi:hypothetical protein
VAAFHRGRQRGVAKGIELQKRRTTAFASAVGGGSSWWCCGYCRLLAGGALFGADDLEALVDEHVVWPVDSDDVDVVIAAADLDDTVDGASGVMRRAQRPWLCSRLSR